VRKAITLSLFSFKQVEEEDGKNFAIIELKIGEIKIYQACAYAVQNKCSAIIIELLTGDVHRIDLIAAKKLIEIAEEELKKREGLREGSLKISGQECKRCARKCNERLHEYSRYRIEPDILQERMLTLESNYPITLKKLVNEIEFLIRRCL
jgi:hypothetical protein